MTTAQFQALSVLGEGPLQGEALRLHRIQRRVISALAQQGLARYYPTGRPPTWRITPEGKSVLRQKSA